MCSSDLSGGNPYGMNVERMDSHGGWIASPGDLVRFAMHVDGFKHTPNILGAKSIAAMTDTRVRDLTVGRVVAGATRQPKARRIQAAIDNAGIVRCTDRVYAGEYVMTAASAVSVASIVRCEDDIYRRCRTPIADLRIVVTKYRVIATKALELVPCAI